jgi:hypothetical protein
MERFDVEAGNNTKIIRAALQCLKQVAVLTRVCIDDCTTGNNDLKVFDAVTSPTKPPVEERDTA